MKLEPSTNLHNPCWEHQDMNLVAPKELQVTLLKKENKLSQQLVKHKEKFTTETNKFQITTW